MPDSSLTSAGFEFEESVARISAESLLVGRRRVGVEEDRMDVFVDGQISSCTNTVLSVIKRVGNSFCCVLATYGACSRPLHVSFDRTVNAKNCPFQYIKMLAWDAN